MRNNGQANSEELRIQGLLDRYLRFRSTNAVPGAHLDEDSLNAFVEGRLSRRESTPILKHLTECSFCLNVTSELALLETAFAADDSPTVSIPVQGPTKVSDVLNGLLSRIFGSQDHAVFAHEETKEDEDPEKTQENKS